MTSVEITMGNQNYILTTDHPASSNGIPVLVSESGCAFGPWDNAIDNPNARMASGESYCCQMTARAIASYARDDHPDDQSVLDLLRRFEGVPCPDLGKPIAK